MNKTRRQKLNTALDRLEELERAKDKDEAMKLLEEARDIAEECLDEEESILDNLPENLAFSSRYDDIQDTVSELEEGCDGISDLMDRVDEEESFSYEELEDDIEEISGHIEYAICK